MADSTWDKGNVSSSAHRQFDIGAGSMTALPFLSIAIKRHAVAKLQNDA